MPSTARYLDIGAEDVLALVRRDRADAPDLDRVVALLRAVQHARYDARWQQARRAFDSADPDAVLAQLRPVLESANYTEVPREVLVRALGESAVSRVNVQADLDAFAELVFFARTRTQQSAAVGRWRRWRQREVVTFQAYDRVAMYARHRDTDWFTAHDRDVDELLVPPGSVHLKLFQDVPEPDLEMLVPGIEVTMRTVDKVVLGVPALISGIVVAVTKLGAALVLSALLVAASVGLRDERPDIDTGALVTLLGGALALGGFLWRQWSKIRTRRFDYLRRLSESLYLKTIADGPRVLFALLDAAEEQDLTETLLAYRAVLETPAPADVLGARVDGWLGGGPRFEVGDALRKLEGLGLADEQNGTWTAVVPSQAVEVLRQRWDAIGDELAGPARVVEG